MRDSLMIDVTIRAMRDIATAIRSFELVAQDGRALPGFAAGAHIDVHLPGAIIRQYSLCGEPGRSDAYTIAVLKTADSRGGSHALHALQEGDRLVIDGPRNHFPLVEGAEHSVLIAGGIGITPLLSMVEELADATRSFELHYCVRNRPSAAFLDRLQRPSLKDRFFLYRDDAGSAGRIDFAEICRAPAENKHLYVCGPGGFMDAALGAARQAGWPEANLHREYFAAAPVGGAAAGMFRVTLSRAGLTLEVKPDQTVVEALAAHGVAIPTSCEQGICGTCLTRVLAGKPEHRDFFLTNAERARNDCFLPCCSRASSEELVLDL
jgi:vanillate O-demethylase ferredoxin subunit